MSAVAAIAAFAAASVPVLRVVAEPGAIIDADVVRVQVGVLGSLLLLLAGFAWRGSGWAVRILSLLSLASAVGLPFFLVSDQPGPVGWAVGMTIIALCAVSFATGLAHWRSLAGAIGTIGTVLAAVAVVVVFVRYERDVELWAGLMLLALALATLVGGAAFASRTELRRSAVAVLLTWLFVLGTSTAILAAGRIPIPTFPSLAERPDRSIRGVVAFVRGDRDDVSRCIYTVPASGGPERRVICESDDRIFEQGGRFIAWTKSGHIVARTAEGPSVYLVVDPMTQRVVRTSPAEPQLPGGSYPLDDINRAAQPSGPRVETEGAIVRVHTRRTATLIVDVRRPSDSTGGRYEFVDAQWSPDGRWVLLTDTEDRLSIVAPDGTSPPRLLVEGASIPAWFIPGTDTYTIDR